MKRIGKYLYAESGMKIVLTLMGMESEEVRRAFLQLDDPATGLDVVPVLWVDKGWVREVVK